MPANAPTLESAPQYEPYPGLRPYTEEQHHYFFGRDHDCRVLIDKILSNKLTLLFAASGVGKSSLLRAAVLPSIRHPEHENLDAIYYNDWVSDPFSGLKDKTLKTLKKFGRIDHDVTPETIAAESLNEFFQFCTLFTRHPLVIVLDQFEEFFQYQRHTLELTQFVQQIAETIVSQESSIALVISMREDFALELNAFKPHLPTLLFDNFYRLEKLTLAGAQAAINEPVKKVGFQYEKTLLTKLLRDLATREQKHDVGTPLPELMDTVEPPFLQIVCSQLYALEKNSPAKTIDLKTYTDHGRAKGLLKSYVDRIIGDFNARDKKIASLCFDHLASRRGTKIAYTAKDLAPIVQVREHPLEAVLKKLEKARLLRSQSRGNVVWYELYHDLFTASIDEWNNTYKSKQRNKRAVIMAVSLITLGILLYAAYDFGVNATNHHLRLSTKTISNEIELYQGKAGSQDIFGLQKYIAQTGFLRSQVEPDKLFKEKPVFSLEKLDIELIETLPLLSRLEHYLIIGDLPRARELAQTYISESGRQRSQAVIDVLGKFQSNTSIEVLKTCLTRVNDPALKGKMILTLGNFNSPGISKILLPLVENSETEPNLRVTTINVLGKLDDPKTVPIIAEQLTNRNPSVRSVAVGALKQMRNPQVIALLEEKLQDPDPAMRAQVAEIIGQFGGSQTTSKIAVQLERENNANVQVALIRALAKQQDSESVKILIEYSKNIHPKNVRNAAVEALIQFDDPTIIPELIGLLEDPSPGLRSAAVKGLEKIASDKVVPALITQLSELDPSTRKDLIALLGKLGDPSAVPVLVKELTNEKKVSLRVAASKALGRIGDPAAIPALDQHLDDANELIGQAVEKALVEIKDPRATAVFISRLDSNLRVVRLRFALLLLEKDDAQAVEAVFRLLGDPDEFLRASLVQELYKKWSRKNLDVLLTVPVLIDMLSDSAYYTRNNAMQALALGNHFGLFDLSDLNHESRQTAIYAVSQQLNENNPLSNGKPIDDENSQRLKFNAICALAALDDPEGIQLLIEVQHGKWPSLYRKLASMLIDGLIKDSPTVVAFVPRLKDLEPNIKLRIVKNLKTKADTEVAPKLLKLVSDSNSEVRAEIAILLGSLRYTEAASVLINQLRVESTPNVISALASALRNLNESNFTTVLIERLQDSALSDEKLRAAVAKSLGEIGGDRAIQALNVSLNDKDDQVRYASAEALGLHGKIEVVPVLIDYLDSLSRDYESADKQEQQELVKKRIDIINLLGMLEDPQAITVLMEQLDSQPLNSTLTAAAVNALAQIGTPEAVDILLDGLNRSQKVALACIEAIKQLNSNEVTEALILRLSSPDRSLRLAAVRALGQLGESQAVAALIQRLKDNDQGVHAEAITALGRIGAPRALSWLTRELNSQNRDVRIAAVRALGDFGDPSALPALRERINDQDMSVHIAAISALGELSDKSAVDLLISELDHKNLSVRTSAAAALGQIGDTRAVPPLTKLLDEKRSSQIVTTTIKSLGMLGSKTAVDPLVDLLNEKNTIKEIRNEVLLALGRIGDDRIADLVKIAYKNDPGPETAVSLLAFDHKEPLALLKELAKDNKKEIRVKLAKLLGAFYTEAGSDLLISQLQDDDPIVRKQALESLGRIKAEKALPEIHRLLDDSDVAIQMAAADALGRLESIDSIDPLKKVLIDHKVAVRVRLKAFSALSKMGNQEALTSLFNAIQEDDDTLGVYAYAWLSDIPEGRQDVLGFMRKRLNEINRQYEQWRLVRDNEPVVTAGSDQMDAWQAKLQKMQPKFKWLFELSYGIAKMSPDEDGIALLDHNLTDVRMGALTALSDSGDISLLKKLIAQYDQSNKPLFRYAAYRAMDNILTTLEINGAPTDLDDLKELRKRLEEREKLIARLGRIIEQIEGTNT